MTQPLRQSTRPFTTRSSFRRAVTWSDLLFAAVALVTLTAVAAVAGPTGTWIKSLSKLHTLGVAAAQYQAANNHYLPLTLVANNSSWCTWSAGGKNCHAYWLSNATFDIEARLRPLNSYVYPGRVFKPGRGTALTSARYTAQADAFRDPSDVVTRQRSWPVATNGVSTYNDVGTSYLWNGAWWNQVSRELPSGSFAAKFNEGTRRIAQGIRHNPALFVWMNDSYCDVIINSATPAFQLRNGYGQINQGCLLHLDGHASYQPLLPGSTDATLNTSTYQFQFTAP